MTRMLYTSSIMNNKPIRRSNFIALLTVALSWQVFTAVADVVSDRITVTVRGHGPDVLLIPGLATSSAVWDATASHLENHFRLHIIQVAALPETPWQGRGKSPV